MDKTSVSGIVLKRILKELEGCFEPYLNMTDKVSSHGFRPLVLLLTDNSVECIALYAFFVKKQLPVILMDQNISGERLSILLEKFQPAWILLPYQSRGYRDGAFDIPEYTGGELYSQYWLYITEKDNVWRRERMNPEVAVLLSTSGSTGVGKFVILSYLNLAVNADSIISSLQLSAGDRGALMLSMAYSYGLSVVNSYLKADGTILLPQGNITQSKYWDGLEEQKVQSFCGVPYTYEIMQKLRIFDRPFRELKLITQAGGKLLPPVRDFLLTEVIKRADRGQKVNFAIMYGQTEATARMSCFFANDHIDKLESVGKAIPGGCFWIDRNDGEKTGEIVYEGDNVFLGYAEIWKDLLVGSSGGIKATGHMLHTGDIGWLDHEDYLYIVGRKSRFVKLCGYRIGLDELEQEVSLAFEKPIVCLPCGEHIDFLVENVWTDKEKILWEQKVKPILHQYHVRPENYSIHFVDCFIRKSNGKRDYHRMEQMVFGSSVNL